MDVLLVGRQLPDNENLGLAYLAASLRENGFGAEVAFLNAWTDMERIARRAVMGGVGLVGLSLPDGNTSVLPLGLGELLRRRGYLGHVTCGGGFATLARSWLLERYSWLDSVVRFAGERPIVGIAEALARGDGVERVPGVTTRGGEGLPAPVTDLAPLTLRPHRGDLPEILGRPMANLTATRGCPGRCAYCGPAALQTLERSEAIRAGVPSEARKRLGIGATRHRSVEDVCDEMASLWHERGVRYFNFVDEDVLPRGEAPALAMLEAWKEGLDRRRVGRLGIGIMSRGDRITPRIALAFRDLGLVSTFVGIETATREEMKRYGRGTGGEEGRRAVEILEDLGVTTVANLMLVHPDSTPATIERAIELLACMRKGIFEATQMMVYHGTRLHERLRAEGRLTGNPIRYAYRIDDPVVDRFAQVFVRLRAHAFFDYSAAYRAHDVGIALRLARRLRPDLRIDSLLDRYERTVAQANALRVESLRRALRLAAEGGGYDECSDLVREIRERAMSPHRAFARIASEIESRFDRAARIRTPTRTAAASLLTFCLAGAPACGARTRVIDDGGAHPHDAGPDAGGTPDSGSDAGSCTPADVVEAEDEVRALVAAADECSSAEIWFDGDGAPSVETWSPEYCGSTRQDIVRRIEAALGDRRWPCLAWSYVPVWGPDEAEYSRMLGRIEEECWDHISYGADLGEIRIVVGPGGMVEEVTGSPWTPPEALDCIRTALQGIEFPCLGNREICPEFSIADC